MVEGCGCGGEKHGHHADPHTQGVCHCGHIPRRFLSKNEKIENLEKYRELSRTSWQESKRNWRPSKRPTDQAISTDQQLFVE